MREIKFRVWNKKDKRFIELFKDNVWLNKPLCELNKKYIVMQYTGLKDKKGKDIYEGDIINGYGGQIKYKQGCYYT